MILSGTVYAEGPGAKLGQALVIHPGVQLGTGYDSNVFFSSGTVGIDSVQGSFYSTIRPVVDISTLSWQRGGGDASRTLDFRLHLGSSIRFLINDQKQVNSHYSINFDGSATLALFPSGPVGFEVFDNYIRTSMPPFGMQRSADNINTNENQAGLRIKLRPGGQRLVVLGQYMNSLFMYETGRFTAKNNMSHDFLLRATWKFFPKTALYVTAQETILQYINPGSSVTPPDQYPLRATAGILGLITPTLTVNFNGGYGNSFTQSNVNYPGNNSYSGFIGLAEVNWKPLVGTALNVGYRHDFGPGLVGTYYDSDGAFAGVSQMVWRLTGTARVSYDRRAFNGDLMADSLLNTRFNEQRVDHMVLGRLQVDLNIRDWFTASIGDDFGQNSSNCKLASESGAHLNIPCSYVRNDVWLRLGVAY